MATSTPVTGELRLALDEIVVRENVRELDVAHVDNLARSIALRELVIGAVKGGYERWPSAPATDGARPRGC